MANRTPRRPHTTDHRRHYVYELWSYRGHCLYVGMTVNLPHRLAAHGRAYWWDEVGRVVATATSGRTMALNLEKRRIKELDPTHNLFHTEGYRRPWKTAEEPEPWTYDGPARRTR